MSIQIYNCYDQLVISHLFLLREIIFSELYLSNTAIPNLPNVVHFQALADAT